MDVITIRIPTAKVRYHFIQPALLQWLCRYDARIILENSKAPAIIITSVLAPAKRELNPNTE